LKIDDSRFFRLPNQQSKINNDNMDAEDLKARTKRFALRIIRVVDALPRTTSGRAIGNQLVRAGTAVGANYRAACRGRSRAEFIAKLGVVIEEADECGYWLELIMEADLLPRWRIEPLHQEANELAAIFVASVQTSRSAISNHKS
jgi:four helix bundle protein